jgi:hypothetical protein
MVCKNCGNSFPTSKVINGKKRNLQKRKFCLECSPFGCRNTRTILPKDKNLIVCSSCKEEKSKSEYHKKGDRLHSMCKSCLHTYQMIRWNKRKVESIKYKGGSCEECGKSNLHPVEYDFHHLRDKEEVWNTLREKSWKKIVKELDKCQLLCCGCHRKKHLNLVLWDF